MSKQNYTIIDALRKELDVESEARRKAQAEKKSMSNLLAMVSHEIRTPLAAIISMSDLLLKAQTDETNRHYASTLKSSAQGLISVLNDVLDFSKLGAGKFTINENLFELNSFMKKFETGLRTQTNQKGLDLDVEIDPQCPKYIYSDALRIQQILHNFTNNALKFTETGAIRIKLKAEHIGQENAFLRFEVHDTGPGISTKAKSRIFNPYTQASDNTSEKYGGTGLGLTICRQLAELMGGSVGCASIEGQGSVFWFNLLLKASSSEALNIASSANTDFDALLGHVLIVDDNEMNQMILAALLRQFGLTFYFTKSGKDALKILTKAKFDVVLMDVRMPEMNGLETTERLRKLGGGFESLPVIALTANTIEDERESYLNAGMNDVIAKPVIVSELYKTLAKHLRIKTAEEKQKYA